jgi:hypothetical protein
VEGLVRETIITYSRLAWRRLRADAAIERKHGLQVLSIEQLAARLAGGFLQTIDSDGLKEAISKAMGADLGELNGIKELPGFPRAAAATLSKAWTAGINLTTVPVSQDKGVGLRIEAISRLEAEVLRQLLPSMQRPIDLVAKALIRTQHAASLFGRISVHGHTEMAPVWRPLLEALARVVEVRWIAGPRRVPSWVEQLRLPTRVTPAEKPRIECRSCASPRHEVLEAMRWARSHIASGEVRPEAIAFVAASPEEWDDHFLALSEMSGLELHFTHGRKVLTTGEGQLAAALAELLLRGFSQARMTRLVALLRNHNSAFKVVPGDWWRALPMDAPLLDVARWREVFGMVSGPDSQDREESLLVLRNLIETLALGLKRALAIGESLFQGRTLAIWRKALTEGPPEALDVTLPTLRLPDPYPPEATIIWGPAADLAAAPRPYAWLIGLTSRAWPRRQAEDPLLPDHIVPTAVLDPLPVHEADRRDFETITCTTPRQIICSYARRDAQGRINGLSPLYPKSGPKIHYPRSRIPEHACGWADRYFARPGEFQALPAAQSAISCWQDWHSPSLTRHDGLVRSNHPLVIASIDRRQSTTSLVKLLRDPLGYLWTYGFRWEEPLETEEPLLLDALAFGNLLHGTLERTVSQLEATRQGGLGVANDDVISGVVDLALDAVAADWERRCPTPPPVIWRRKLEDIRVLAFAALTYREDPLPNQRSWAEVRFGSDPKHESPIDHVQAGLPWHPYTTVVIPGTTVAIGGSIDRLDVAGDGSGARVTDYKSGKPPSQSRALVVKGGAELQRCLYAFAVSALVPGLKDVEARLLYPKGGRDGLHVLSNRQEVLEELARFIGAAQRHALAGEMLPGAGAQDAFNDLDFALPGGAKEAYFELKGQLVARCLNSLAPLWEMP